MATLTKILYDILDESTIIEIPNIFAGTANGDESARDGLLTFFPLPSTGIIFGGITSVTQYQLDVWNQDMYYAEEMKEQVIKELSGKAGRYGDKSLIFTMDSDLGGVYDIDNNIWQYTVIFNIKYNR